MKRKALCVLVCILLLAALMLTACGNGLVFDDKAEIRFAKTHRKQLEQCVDIIYSEYLPKGGSFTFFEEDGCLYMRGEEIVMNDWDGSAKEIACPEILKLIRAGGVHRITVMNQNGFSHSTEFCLKTLGMGSYSSACIVYIPSGQIEDSVRYSTRMQFSEFREGYMGTIEGTDDYMYYVSLWPNWFYVEFGD